MTEVYENLYVGSDKDFEKASDKGFAICSCCKDGPYGHRAVLGYATMAAPKDENYLSVLRGKHLALNLVDSEDVDFIPDKVINAALEFIDVHLKKGDKVLLHCNLGASRSPVIAMIYLRTIGELPNSLSRAIKMMIAFYPKFDPGMGMLRYARKRFNELNI